MNEHETEKPTSRDSPHSKACWVIRKVIREHPEGMTTEEIIAAVRKHWPGDKDFRGKGGELRIGAAQQWLRRGNVIRWVPANE